MAKYRYRDSYQGPRSVAPDVIVTACEALETTGPLTASRVLEAAQPPEAPLHPLFEWDDQVAAHAHRLAQARSVIKAVELVIDHGPDQPRDLVPFRFHVPAPRPQEEGTYVPGTVLIANMSQFDRALREALRVLDASEKLVHHLRRLVDGKEETVAAQLAVAHEGYHLIRAALEGLKAA